MVYREAADLVGSQPPVAGLIAHAEAGYDLALIASDASVPHRTTAKLVSAYTAAEVARTLAGAISSWRD